MHARRRWEEEQKGLWNRRELVSLSGIGAVALAFDMVGRSESPTRSRPEFSANPFSLGIASGDPLPDSVVLWTRLAPEPLESFGGMDAVTVPVGWQVAEDAGFRRVVRSGTALAFPEYVHSVHVDVRGLRPGREYFYRFRAGAELSPVGRTKTAPAPWETVGSLAFAAVSCQAWFDGYFTAYRHVAEEDIDLVVHLGDYLYEYSVQTNGGRPDMQLPEKYNRVTTLLNDYRDRYALYKLDPDLQAAHAAFPWIVTWDDHEVVNNYAADDHPSLPPADFLVRRANAYRAYWEHMPLRRQLEPAGPDLALYRRFTFGGLMELSMLDTRQYRDDQACGDGLRTDCAERLDPARTLLGTAQESWLLDGLGRSRATWNVLGQQLMMAQLDFTTEPGQAFSMDLWDGYKPARDRLVAGFSTHGVANPVVLSGDIHRCMAAEIKADFDNPDSETVATEFIGTSISSGLDGADADEFAAPFLANQHVKFYNSQRGYLRCAVTPELLQVDYRSLPFVRERGADVYTRASFVTEEGTPGLHQIADNPPRGRRFATDIPPPEPLDNPPDE